MAAVTRLFDGVRGSRVLLLARQLAVAAVLGSALGLLAPKLGSQVSTSSSNYKLVFVLAALVGLSATVFSGDLRRSLLLLAVATIPINIGFTLFGIGRGVAPHEGGAAAGIVLNLFDFPLLALIGIWVVDVLCQRVRVKFTWMDLAFLVVIAWSIASIGNATDIALSEWEIARMVKLYLFGRAAASYVTTGRTMELVLAVLLLGLIAQAVIGFLEYTRGLRLNLGGVQFGDAPGGIRIGGTVGDPVTFGAYVGALVSLGFTLWILAPTRLRAMGGLAGLMGLFPLIFTYARSAWLWLAVSLMLVLGLTWITRGVQRGSLLRLSAVVLVAAFIVVPYFGLITQRLGQLTATSGTVVRRLHLAIIAENMIRAHPLFGIGLNNFTTVVPLFDTVGEAQHLNEPVHSVYLLVAAETGVPGLILFVVFLGSIAWLAIKTIRSGNRFWSVCACALLCALLVIAGTNLTDFHLRRNVLYALFWLLVGLITAASQAAELNVDHVALSPGLGRRLKRRPPLPYQHTEALERVWPART